MDQQDRLGFLDEGTEMSVLTRAHDWSGTPLGPVAAWSETMRSLAGIMLGATQPMFVCWGPGRVMLYNDAYAKVLGARHPAALGRPFFDTWPEIGEILIPLMDRVFAGASIHMDDISLVIERDGHPEEAHFAFSYTPVRDAGGQVVGLFCVCNETTASILAERRRGVLLALADDTRALTDPHEIMAASAAALCRHLRASLVGFATPDPDGDGLLIGPHSGFGFDGRSGDTAPSSPIRLASPEHPNVQATEIHDCLDLESGSWAELGMRAVVSVPLTRDGRLTAMLCVAQSTPRRWTSDEVLLIEEVAQRSDDAAERAQSELALRTSDAYVRLLLESTAEGFYAVDCSGATTLCNAAFLKMLGFASEADAIGRRLHDVIHHSHADGSAYCVRDCPIYICARDGTPAHILHETFFRLDGTALPVEYWVRPILRHGKLAGAICNFLDVTERKRAQDALRDETRILEILNQTGSSLAGELDLEHVVQRVTDAGVALTGAAFGAFFYNVLDETGENFELFALSGIDRAAFDAFPMPRTTELFGATFRGEGPVRSDDLRSDPRRDAGAANSELPEDRISVRSALALPVTSRTGEVIGGLLFCHSEPGRFSERHERLMVGVSAQAAVAIDNAQLFRSARRELDERKLAEQQLHELNETLAQRIRVALAERETVEEALRQSQKMEAVGQLTGGLAHDFNNLLTGIAGSLELLSIRIGQGRINDLDRYINAAQGAATRAAALTHRLLAFSRRQTLDPRPTNVNRLIGGMEELIRRSVGPAVDIEVVATAGLWTAQVDPNQLENALLNLCINARDAMPEGGRLVIETANKRLDERAARSRELAPGQYLSLCVTDSGTGMTPEVTARAFDPFFTTKPIGQGTGLGLSMIYGFARQSGGQVRIYSELGQGTTMCIYLPRYLGDEDADDQSETLPVTPRADAGETVLVIDDEPTVRMLATEILEDLGYTAIEAADGAAGLKILQSNVRIDLLVTDVGLPGGMNGRQVADAGRAIRPELNVLFITGYAENATVSKSYLEPGMQVLTKPFTMETLANQIKALISRP